MSSSRDNLQWAVHHHRSGNYRQAEEYYRKVLEDEPGHADAHHLLGLVALAQDQPDRAIEHIQAAIRCDPAPAEFHFHLGSALRRAGRLEEAVASYAHAVRLDPNSAAMRDELGTVLRESGRLAEAEASYREAVRLDPALAAAHNNLGNALQDQGRWEEAVAAFQAAARLRPEAAEIHFNLGNCLRVQRRVAEAAAAYRQAALCKPDFAMAHHQLGLVLHALRQFAEAAACQRRALELQPDLVQACNPLGAALQMLGNLEEAKACFNRALEADPGNVAVHFNLANLFHAQGNLTAAEASYQTVLRAVPEHCDSLTGMAILCLTRGDLTAAGQFVERALGRWPQAATARSIHAILLLAQGDLAAGFREYEYRLTASAVARRTFAQPRWDGSRIVGRTLLVHAEHGVGNTMQFIRYDPMVRQRAGGGRVLVEVDPAIVPLLATSGFRDLVPQGDPSPHFDLEVPMMSLPAIFETTLDTIPAEVPYFHADSKLIRSWRTRLANVPGFKVGIGWQSGANPGDDRSVPPSCFAPLARIPGVTLISLQPDSVAEQVGQAAEEAGAMTLAGLDQQAGAFMDTAAVIKNLDLVVTCDSPLAHLAGGLGAKVWVALGAAPEWRWMLERADSPWYPTMRLFRRGSADDWNAVFARVADELARVVGGGRR